MVKKFRLNFAGIVLLAAAVPCGLPTCVVFAQNPAVTENLPPAGDQPDDPGPLSTDLSPRLRSSDIHKAMRRVADWQLHRLEKTPSYEWTYAALYAGLLSASDTLGDPRYENAVRAIAEHYHWQLGPRRLHADDQAIGQSYLALYRKSHNAAEIDPLRKQFDEIMLTPDDPAKPVWWWCDALFMAPPVWAGLSAATDQHKYIDYMNREWAVTQGLLYDNQVHLFSRDARYLDKKEANGQKIFWARGNGWVMGGLARVITLLPSSDPSRDGYIKTFKEMASEVASLQGKDGLWRPGLLDEASYPLPETSGSAFFAYAFAWGINHGYLDRHAYQPVVEKAWKGLIAHIYEDGRLGCVQPIGDSPSHYKESASYVFGTGAFLLAGSEIDKLATGKHKAE